MCLYTAELPSCPKDDLQTDIDLSGMSGPPFNLFVGNLSLDANDDDLRALFEQHVKVSDAKVVVTEGRKRGIAFVMVPTREDARSAIQKLNNFVRVFTDYVICRSVLFLKITIFLTMILV